MTQADLVRLYFNKESAYNSWDYCFNQQCPLAQECAHYLSVTYKKPEQTKGYAQELGYHTFFWSLAYVDWYQDKQPTKDEAFGKLLKRIHPGAIVLLHSTSSTNAQILDELLTKWEEMGYTIKPLTELAGAAT